jgi:glycosyltransferase involved in cell wall biosynthesis
VDRLLESFSLLPSLDHHRLLIVGDGPAASALQELANHLNIQDKVIFTGFRSDIGNLLQAMDLFVLPSQGEPFGIAILEALAAGLPVFVFADAGGAIELMGEQSAITTPLEMAQSLAQQTPSTPQQPLDYFRIERMADQFLQLYKEIAHA